VGAGIVGDEELTSHVEDSKDQIVLLDAQREQRFQP
jgi:hypothetical protein